MHDKVFPTGEAASRLRDLGSHTPGASPDELKALEILQPLYSHMADQIHSSIVPSGFIMLTETALYDIEKSNPAPGGVPYSLFAMLARLRRIDAARAAFGDEFAELVKDDLSEINA